jgi:hypothetical protein
MISSSAATTITAATAAPAIFSALINDIPDDVPDPANGNEFGQVPAGRGRWLELIPETGNRSKLKTNPGVLQSYVTYDTLSGR